MPDESLPRWDMTGVFPSLESPEFNDAFAAALEQLRVLGELFDKYEVRRRSDSSVGSEWAAAYETVTASLNALDESIRTLGSYIGCFVTTDARNDIAKAHESLLDAQTVPLRKLHTRYIAWVGSSDTDALLATSAVARSNELYVRRAKELQRHQMTEAEEDLAAELSPSSIIAWSRLHGNVSALMSVPVVVRGEQQTLPMSAVRSLGNDPDREVRRAAFEAELKAWESTAAPMCAALNGVKGFQGTIRRRRGYTDDIEPTLMANSIDLPTLEAMQEACVEAFPDFRRYMAAKAKALGLEQLAWYDVTAPLGQPKKKWSWSEAEAFIRTHFARYSDRLAAFAERSFRERWIDAEPRIGKEGGAYCTGIRPGESRVMMNFDGSFTGVSTLAHELGHAYHNLNLGDRTPLQRRTPSTLAETASIFCETLCFDAALHDAARDERLALLDTSLQRDLMVVVDIHSRFLFEKAVFDRRAARDLTELELCDLMLDAQHQTYGDGVSPLHPYMWAVKGHYYGPTFYNYPYTFGLLFGLGLYAYYGEKPAAFREKYDRFLSCTGLADARTLGSEFGLEVGSRAFWRSSLDVIRREIVEFEALVSA